MGDYSIIFARSAERELESLPSKAVNQIFPKIASLSEKPRPRGCKKLSGEGNLWRIRVGNYRVIYSIDDVGHIVDVIQVRHRSDAYR